MLFAFNVNYVPEFLFFFLEEFLPIQGEVLRGSECYVIMCICQTVKEHFTFCFPEKIKKTDDIKPFSF